MVGLHTLSAVITYCKLVASTCLARACGTSMPATHLCRCLFIRMYVHTYVYGELCGSSYIANNRTNCDLKLSIILC